MSVRNEIWRVTKHNVVLACIDDTVHAAAAPPFWTRYRVAALWIASYLFGLAFGYATQGVGP